MGIARVSKVGIVVHGSEKESLLSKLQESGILHITDLRKKKPPYLNFQHEPYEEELERQLTRLERVIQFLRQFVKSDTFGGLMSEKLPVTYDEYKKIVNDKKVWHIVEEVEHIDKQLTALAQEESRLLQEKERLMPWRNLTVTPKVMREMKHVEVWTAILENPPRDWEDKLRDVPLYIEVINQVANRVYLLLIFHKDDREAVTKHLTDLGIERIELGELELSPSEALHELDVRLEELSKERATLLARLQSIGTNLKPLLIMCDHYRIVLNHRKAIAKGGNTDYTFVIEGWVKERDLPQLRKIIETTHSATMEVIDAHDETPPVELDNKRPFKPFEILTKLYSTPDYKEIDPSPLMAPFVIIFFALCMTDAGYGLVLGVLSLLAMYKFKPARRFLSIIAAGSFATISIGALTGGWFGNLHEIFRNPLFIKLRERMMVMDPINEALKFFAIALILGVIQILFGYTLRFIRGLRERDKAGALSEGLGWILFWVGFFTLIAQIMPHWKAVMDALKASIFAFIMQIIKLVIKHAFVACLVSMVGIFLIFGYGGYPSRSFVKRLFKGLFAFYKGFISTISDILSYSRLMALGLVTLGMALSMNVLYEIFVRFPVIGPVVGVFIFVFGHMFAIVINALGGFIHTLRLQYAEFFSKFYRGGGEPFTPLSYDTRYIELVKKEA